MTAGGWVMITLSWSFIIGLSAFCMKRIIGLKNSQADHIKPIYEIDTGDLDGSEKKKNK
ncbi:hypothetical protein MNBD_NITROSPINAE04-472 [hydrothermal vent metagenome]|uniref:Uncharacterized protein n=1 Tax=hydrothermal vent metagenome TaxID=652676 RepID=A0A3B1C767_9ZZZZ